MRGCPCFVPEPGQNIYLPSSKKKSAGPEFESLEANMDALARRPLTI